jgi:hypothetical protein
MLNSPLSRYREWMKKWSGHIDSRDIDSIVRGDKLLWMKHIFTRNLLLKLRREFVIKTQLGDFSDFNSIIFTRIINKDDKLYDLLEIIVDNW